MSDREPVTLPHGMMGLLDAEAREGESRSAVLERLIMVAFTRLTATRKYASKVAKASKKVSRKAKVAKVESLPLAPNGSWYEPTTPDVIPPAPVEVSPVVVADAVIDVPKPMLTMADLAAGEPCFDVDCDAADAAKEPSNAS